MGLDNIPNEYPCITKNTAVLNAADQIMCEDTHAAGGCPWKNEYEKSDPGTPVYGMMGTNCWYRGKVGQWMIASLEGRGFIPPFDLYGLSEQNDSLTGEQCIELSIWLEDHAEDYVAIIQTDLTEKEIEEELEQYRYLVWWLRWAGEHANGIHAWY